MTMYHVEFEEGDSIVIKANSPTEAKRLAFSLYPDTGDPSSYITRPVTRYWLDKAKKRYGAEAINSAIRGETYIFNRGFELLPGLTRT